MPLPDANVVPQDGRLNLPSSSPAGIIGMLGACSLGTANSPILVTDRDKVATQFGTGPLADALRDALRAGARTIVAVRTNPSAAQLPNNPVAAGDPVEAILAQAPVQAGTGACAASAPNRVLSHGDVLHVEIVDAGAVGVATFKWRVGTGEWSAPATVQASVPLSGTGVTLAFEDGESGTSFQAGDKFDFVTVAYQTGTLSVSGEPAVSMAVHVEITTSGQLNAAAFKYSLDDGPLSAAQTVQATVVLPDTGLTLAFANGQTAPEASFLEGSSWDFEVVAAGATMDDLVDAAEAVVNKKIPVEFIHVAAPTDSAAWISFQALAEEWRTDRRLFTWFLCQARDCDLDEETVDEYVQALLDEKDDASVNRVAVVAVPVVIDGVERNGGGILAGRLASLARVSTSAGKVALGPLPVSGLGLQDDEGNTLLNDGHIEILDAAGFCTFREYAGLSGIYVTNGRMLVDDTSDYRWIEWRRAMDKACREVRLAALRRVHDDGDAAGLAALQAALQAPLDRMAASREVAAARATIPEGQDVAATSTVNVKVGILPTPTMRWIEVEIGFENSKA